MGVIIMELYKILSKIEELDISENEKNFLREALLLQFENRDIDFDDFESKYRELVDKYYGGN